LSALLNFLVYTWRQIIDKHFGPKSKHAVWVGYLHVHATTEVNASLNDDLLAAVINFAELRLVIFCQVTLTHSVCQTNSRINTLRNGSAERLCTQCVQSRKQRPVVVWRLMQ